MPNTIPTPDALSRRKVLTGGLAAGVAWTAPSILRLDKAGATVGSCTNVTVNWASVSGPTGGVYTVTGTSGTATITATVTPNLSTGATPTVGISGGQFYVGMTGHQIGDTYDIALSFTDSSGQVCQASTMVLDIDRNGRGLGCPTNSRFEDNINSLTGPGIVTTNFGNLIETPTGNFVSSLSCKTSDTENLGISWTSTAAVTGAGFTWLADTPPGTDTVLDYQVIRVDPVVMCVQPTAAGAAPAGLEASRAVAYPGFKLIQRNDTD